MHHSPDNSTPCAAARAARLLGFRWFVREPTTEAGVMMLFAAVAGELGFAIECVQPGFPDCLAMRRVGRGRWHLVRIEFELRARNFARHRHDARGCDLLVCWIDDWGKQCPVKVLELRSVVRRLKGWRGNTTPP